MTRGFSGRLARGIRNRLLEETSHPGTEVLPYPLQRGIVRQVAIPAEAAGRSDLLPLWAGQGASLSRHTGASALLEALVSEVTSIAGPVAEWSANRRQGQA